MHSGTASSNKKDLEAMVKKMQEEMKNQKK